MASTYSPTLRIELIGNGDQSGNWGTTTNNNLGTVIEQAITGIQSITMSNANYTLTNFNGAADEARNIALIIGGTNSAIRTVIAPDAEKTYIVANNTSGGFAVRLRTVSGTGTLIPNGVTVWVYCDGLEFYIVGQSYTALNTPDTIVSRDGSGNFAAGTITASLVGNVTGNASGLSATLAVGSGGTGSTGLTANSVMLGNGSSALSANMVAPGSSGNVLTSNGTTWVSQAPGSAGAFPAGTRMSFQQTSAPTGWTKDTSTANLNDSLMTITTGSVTSGGTTGFVTWNSSGTTGATTLSTAQMPSHTHFSGINRDSTFSGSTANVVFNTNAPNPVNTGATGGGGSHTHPVSSDIKYFSFIIAVKN
jgi:hypothetical protein